MYIGEISKLTGASRKAIRYYEEIGLIQGIIRSGTYRIYNEHHVVIVSMIKKAQALGFTLADITPLVAIKHNENRFPTEISDSLIEEKRAQIKLQIQQANKLDLELLTLKKELQNMFIET